MQRISTQNTPLTSARKGSSQGLVEFKDLNKKSQKKMRKIVLAMSTMSPTASMSMVLSILTVGSSNAAPAPGPTAIFILTLHVLNLAPLSHLVLPVSIQAAFPHIILRLGVVDAATALSTGNLHFFTALAKAYPLTVALIHSAAEYSPITLSRIVQQGGASITTDLTVVFLFHLPYSTRRVTHPASLFFHWP